MNNGNLALKLVEGTKADRDQYIDRVEVLDKMKELVMMPDNKYIKSVDVAKYYEVSLDTIRTVKNRHNDEFKKDGLITLDGLELQEYKRKIAFQGATLKAKKNITLYTRKAVLRMGMLLVNSPVAIKIRDYLLNVEEKTTQQQKQALLKYKGEWNQEIENYVVENMNKKREAGTKIYDCIDEVAKELGAKRSLINARWYGTGNYSEQALKNVKIVEKVIPIETKQDNIDTTLDKHFINQNKLIMDLMYEVKTLHSSNENLHKDIAKLWRGYKEVSEVNRDLNNTIKNELKNIKQDLKQFKDIVGENFKDKVETMTKQIELKSKKIKLQKEEIQRTKMALADAILDENNNVKSKGQSFKMSKNGNLTKMD